MQVNLRSERVINRRIARLPGVQAELAGHAKAIVALGETLFAPHRKTGSHHFEAHRLRVRYGRIDWFASFVGPAAAAVENGHWHNFTNKWVEGLHCLRNAARAHSGVS